jgi:hypothetical protein
MQQRCSRSLPTAAKQLSALKRCALPNIMLLSAEMQQISLQHTADLSRISEKFLQRDLQLIERLERTDAQAADKVRETQGSLESLQRNLLHLSASLCISLLQRCSGSSIRTLCGSLESERSAASLLHLCCISAASLLHLCCTERSAPSLLHGEICCMLQRDLLHLCCISAERLDAMQQILPAARLCGKHRDVLHLFEAKYGIKFGEMQLAASLLLHLCRERCSGDELFSLLQRDALQKA